MAWPLTQWRVPVGVWGASWKMWPMCPSHRLQRISVRTMPWESSRYTESAPASMPSQKLGQPQPEWNLCWAL